MANLDDLNYKSLTEMTKDEALERIRQIRLSRRTPVRTTKTIRRKVEKASPKVSSDEAAELLKLLTGD